MKGMVWMGYYDEDYQYRTNPKRKSKVGYFLSGLIGALIGGFLIAMIIPTLAKTGILPLDIGLKNSDVNPTERNLIEKNNGNPITQNVSVEVETDITKAVDKALDAVVGITNLQGGNLWQQASEAGTGSGVIYKKEGNTAFVVTNQHVIEGASDIEVTLANGEKVEAELLGSDIWTDLAVLRMDASQINAVAEFGNSDSLRLGEPVIAIGNPLGLEFAGSITQGIISGLERTVPLDFNEDGNPDWNAEVLQTDAAINPGNSGGALVNIAGQVIGINSMKIAQEQVEGIGFSIPVNIAIPIIEDLEGFGEVKRPYMGVSLQDLNSVSIYHQNQTLHLPDEVTAGLIVVEVVTGSPAADAGLREMDVIVKLDGEEIHSMIELRKHLYTKKNVGESLMVGFYRDGEYRETKMVLVEESL